MSAWFKHLTPGVLVSYQLPKLKKLADVIIDIQSSTSKTPCTIVGRQSKFNLGDPTIVGATITVQTPLSWGEQSKVQPQALHYHGANSQKFNLKHSTIVGRQSKFNLKALHYRGAESQSLTSSTPLTIAFAVNNYGVNHIKRAGFLLCCGQNSNLSSVVGVHKRVVDREQVSTMKTLLVLFVVFVSISHGFPFKDLASKEKHVHKRTHNPLSVRFPGGSILVTVSSQGSNYNDPSNTGTQLFDKTGIEFVSLSDNFRVSEFTSKDGARYFRLSPRLIECLQRVRSASGRSITVNSGYHTVSHNTNEGGAPSSRHVSGTAADIRFTDGTSAETLAGYVVDECVPLFRGYGEDIGLGRYSGNYIHVDHRSHFSTWSFSSTVSDTAWRYWVVQRIAASGSTCSGYFPCRLGSCVYKTWVCDRDNDCGDNSDELGSTSACSTNNMIPSSGGGDGGGTNDGTDGGTNDGSGGDTGGGTGGSTGDIPSGDGCFPADATVYTDDPGTPVKQMRDVHIGDQVLSITDNGEASFRPVVAFIDRHPKKKTTFVQLKTEDGHTLQLTPHHLLFTNQSSEPIFATEVHIDEYLLIADTHNKMQLTPSKVKEITVVEMMGAYAPLTTEGTIVVDGVYASCYAFFKDHQLSQTLFSPLRFLSTIAPKWTIAEPENGIHWYPQLLTSIGRLMYPLISDKFGETGAACLHH